MGFPQNVKTMANAKLTLHAVGLNFHVRPHDVLMNIRVFIFALLTVLCFTGCTSSTNISKRDPFYNYVGQTVELHCPVDVVGHSGVWFGGDKGIHTLHTAQYGIIESGTEGQEREFYGENSHVFSGSGDNYGNVLEVLTVGHRVQIDSVWDEVIADEEQIIAYGHTTIPPSTNEVSFAYAWGEFWMLWRAPWEPNDTPQKRAPTGELPAHFDYDMFKAPTNTPTWGAKVKP